MADGTYKCHDCHMTFGTLNLLQKHKQKFCVGGSVGDPDSLRLRKGLRSDDPIARPYSPEEKPVSGGRKLEDKVHQLQVLKAEREKSRDIRNLQERILLDNLEDTDVQLGYGPSQRSVSRLPLSKDKEIKRLQLEYEMLREKELQQKTEVLVGYGRGISPMLRESRLDNYSPMSDSSMSIHLPDDEYQKYNPDQDQQIKQLAENHGRQMEYLQLRNQDLEKQRQDIQRRLAELGNKGRPTGGEDSAHLLAELRAQEERNQRALDDLKRQLYDINHQRINVIEVDKGQPVPPPLPPPPVETERKSYIYPIYYGNSMVAEISAIRQAYLQNGGNDPDILHQMAQMQAEAQNIEDQMKKHGYDRRHREKKDPGQITQLELENERLHRELMLLQEQNFLARERKKTDREGRNLKRYHSFNQHDSGQHMHDKLEQFVEKYETYGNSMFHSSSPRGTHKESEAKRKHRDDNFSYKPQRSDSHGRPTKVPPLDLRGINDNNYDSLRREQPQPRPKWIERTAKPSSTKDTNPLKWDFNPDFQRAYDRKYGSGYPHSETKSLYYPQSRKQSGSHQSIRTEIQDGVVEPRRYRSYMPKASLSESDLLGLYQKNSNSRDLLVPAQDRNITKYNVRNMYSMPADRKYETISLQQKEEMNPQTKNIISTVTYKQEKIKEKATV